MQPVRYRWPVAVGALFLAGAASAQPDFPVRYDQGNGQLNGTGLVRVTTDGVESFSNGFNGFNQNGYFDYFTLSGQISGSGTTGGGFGVPARSSTSGNYRSDFSSSLVGNPVLTISGSSGNFGYLDATAANQTASGSGSSHFDFSFSVTAPIIATWSGNHATLSYNGVPLPWGGAAIAVLQPGVYRLDGNSFASAGIGGNSGRVDFGDGTGFNLQIGIPAPSSVALLGIAGLAAVRRRR